MGFAYPACHDAAEVLARCRSRRVSDAIRAIECSLHSQHSTRIADPTQASGENTSATAAAGATLKRRRITSIAACVLDCVRASAASRNGERRAADPPQHQHQMVSGPCALERTERLGSISCRSPMMMTCSCPLYATETIYYGDCRETWLSCGASNGI